MTPLAPTACKPDWFIAASKSLRLIEENVHKYENDERIPPSFEVIESVQLFLETLRTLAPVNAAIAEPKLFVSPNGDIVATLGCRPQTLNIRFGTAASYVLVHPKFGTSKGEGASGAIEMAIKHFQTI